MSYLIIFGGAVLFFSIGGFIHYRMENGPHEFDTEYQRRMAQPMFAFYVAGFACLIALPIEFALGSKGNVFLLLGAFLVSIVLNYIARDPDDVTKTRMGEPVEFKPPTGQQRYGQSGGGDGSSSSTSSAAGAEAELDMDGDGDAD